MANDRLFRLGDVLETLKRYGIQAPDYIKTERRLGTGGSVMDQIVRVYIKSGPGQNDWHPRPMGMYVTRPDKNSPSFGVVTEDQKIDALKAFAAWQGWPDDARIRAIDDEIPELIWTDP